ncbi:MAG: hypothetical protein IAX21_09975 [Candidatus Bathyarchaeota archaeon]|nr:MAG: Sjogren's syndrome/scleroderma autoantigen 1 family protein [Candidatus Bathyarchaeum tardum]WNZ28949.1 MAG: hypothetical protein IAX21_09975 [Candidatus Bathyarchaeota archaeon]
MTENSESIKVMADLLRQGATLTQHSCPACSSPLFKLQNKDIWCAKCQKRVIIVKEGDPEPEVSKAPMFSSLESTIIKKIQNLEKQLEEENDPEKITKLGETVSSLLESLEKIKNMKK